MPYSVNAGSASASGSLLVMSPKYESKVLFSLFMTMMCSVRGSIWRRLAAHNTALRTDPPPVGAGMHGSRAGSGSERSYRGASWLLATTCAVHLSKVEARAAVFGRSITERLPSVWEPTTGITWPYQPGPDPSPRRFVT